MKQIAILITLIFFGYVGDVSAQVINWDATKKWKIYDIDEMKGFQYSADTLRNFKSIELGDSKALEFLKAMKVLPKDHSYVWMGLYVATYEDSKLNVRKIVFSTYGGFIYDPVTKLYYELPENYRRDWIDFLADKAAELTAQ